MKIALLILNGNLSINHVLDTAIEMAAESPCFFQTVVFNRSLDLEEYHYLFPNDLSLTRNSFTNEAIKDEDAAILQDNIRLCKEKFNAAKLNYSIDPDSDLSLEKLLSLSAYADFILADGTHNIGHYQLADILIKAHCPHYLVAPAFEKPASVLFTFDGSAASVLAIKSFSQLFPEYKPLPHYLAYVGDKDKNELPNAQYISNWLDKQLNKVNISVLSGHVSEILPAYIKSIEKPIVTMGSFGRSALSRFFHKSLAATIREETACSLYITHQ